MSVRIQGNALKAASYSLTESAGAFLPAPPSIDASSIDASSIAEALVQKVEKVLKKKSTEKQEVVSEDVLELGRHIGMNDLCWMRRPSSQPDFAHLGVMVQIGQGDTLVDAFWCCIALTFLSQADTQTAARFFFAIWRIKLGSIEKRLNCFLSKQALAASVFQTSWKNSRGATMIVLKRFLRLSPLRRCTLTMRILTETRFSSF
jgi:hypothetical protein